MAIEITSSGNNLKVKHSATDIKSYPKDDITVTSRGDNLILILGKTREVESLPQSDVTVPTHTDLADLQAKVLLLIGDVDFGGGGVGTLLGSVITGIDGTTTSDNIIDTVAASKLMYVTKMILRLESVSGGGPTAKVQLGYNSPNFDDVISNTTLNGLTTADDAFIIDVEGVVTAGQATDELTMRVDTGAGFTTYDLSVAVLGIIIDA